MKLRKFMIDDVEVIEQEPCRKTLYFNDGKNKPYFHKIYLPYCVTFIRKHSYKKNYIKSLHFGFSLTKWDEEQKLLLAPLNTTFNEGLLVCLRPTLEDFWTSPYTNAASTFVMDATFKSFSRWSALSEEQCWDQYKSWPATLIDKSRIYQHFCNEESDIFKSIVDFKDVMQPLNQCALNHIVDLID